VQKQHREKKTLDRPTHLYNYQHVVLRTETKTFSLIIETYGLYSTLIMEREIVKISVKIPLPATEVKKMYLYICICMYICIYYIFHPIANKCVHSFVFTVFILCTHWKFSLLLQQEFCYSYGCNFKWKHVFSFRVNSEVLPSFCLFIVYVATRPTCASLSRRVMRWIEKDAKESRIDQFSYPVPIFASPKFCERENNKK
jgi:hypothetical protein